MKKKRDPGAEVILVSKGPGPLLAEIIQKLIQQRKQKENRKLRREGRKEEATGLPNIEADLPLDNDIAYLANIALEPGLIKTPAWSGALVWFLERDYEWTLWFLTNVRKKLDQKRASATGQAEIRMRGEGFCKVAPLLEHLSDTPLRFSIAAEKKLLKEQVDNSGLSAKTIENLRGKAHARDRK